MFHSLFSDLYRIPTRFEIKPSAVQFEILFLIFFSRFKNVFIHFTNFRYLWTIGDRPLSQIFCQKIDLFF